MDEGLPVAVKHLVLEESLEEKGKGGLHGLWLVKMLKKFFFTKGACSKGTCSRESGFNDNGATAAFKPPQQTVRCAILKDHIK